jgi:HAD superfamily hydrolase (TIGR01484 family)
MPDRVRHRLRGVFTDIDDTLTTDGRLTADAYRALERLHDAGLLLIAVTGRPAGWCDHIARMWPVDGVVGENGALYMVHDRGARTLRMRLGPGDEPTARQRRLASIGERILREVPGAALASDQSYRLTDLAIDYREDVPRLSERAVARIVELMQAEGMTAKVSSIHVNGWFGAYDKLGMTRTLMRERFGTDLDLSRDEFVFIGDSPNDAPMFEYFPVAVGVANVRDYGNAIEPLPAYATAGRSGAGFVEFADFLLAGR